MVPPLFEETQRFRQPWLWALNLVVLVGPGLFLGWGVVQQLVLGEPWGDRPLSDGALIAVTALVLALCGGLFWLLWSARLTTTVVPGALRLRFAPFHRRERVFAADDVARAAPVAYRPVREYGGWGIRWSPRGRAYNVSGNHGVRLTLRDGTRLLVGSARHEQLARALAAAGFTVGPEPG